MHIRSGVGEEWERKFGTASFEVPGSYITPEQFFETVATAINNEEPSSFVRYSDGEGGFLVQAAGTDRYPAAAELLGGLLSHFFGCHAGALAHRDAAAIGQLLCRSVADADIVGMPFLTDVQQWVERRDRTGDTESVRVSCALEELFRQFLSAFNPSRQKFTFVGFHTWFAGTKIFRLVARSKHVSFITCYPELQPILERYLPHSKIKLWIVPPRGADRDLRTFSRHYPDVFEELASTVTVPYRGAPFIVGAGPLGKVYCSLIKERGGIGLDLGSVFDLWVGKATRTWITDEKLEKFSIR